MSVQFGCLFITITPSDRKQYHCPNTGLPRVEDSDREKSSSLNNFFGTENILLGRENIGSQKTYAKIYREVISDIYFDDKFLDDIYSIPRVKHCYSLDEIEKFKKRWKY